MAAVELGIARPTVRFFVHAEKPAAWTLQAWADDRHLAGEFRPEEPGQIWVLGTLRPPELGAVVAHEVAHAAWSARYGSPWPSEPGYEAKRAADEAAAVDFASRFMRRLNKKWRP